MEVSLPLHLESTCSTNGGPVLDNHVPESPRPPDWYRLWHTSGNYRDELSSAAALDEVLHQADLGKLYREVTGFLAARRDAQADANGIVRIDRVLIPGPRLLRAGWREHAIGFEIKRSGEKIGRPIAQMIDYLHGTWSLTPAVQIRLSWLCLWPAPKQNGPIASILSQHRLCTAERTRSTLLRMFSGEKKVLRVDNNGNIEVGDLRFGRKAGSR